MFILKILFAPLSLILSLFVWLCAGLLSCSGFVFKLASGLLSLLAIYVGMKLGGVVAMILAPVLLLMLRNLWRAGMFHATVRDLTMAARDMAAILHGKPEETDPPEPEKPGETVQKMEKES